MTGTIKKLVPDKGFGFITGENDKNDVFFHHTVVQDAAFDELREGQQVEFDEEQCDKGKRAKLVRVS